MTMTRTRRLGALLRANPELVYLLAVLVASIAVGYVTRGLYWTTN